MTPENATARTGLADRSWTEPARAMASAVDAAVSSAMSADPVAFDAATAELRRVDQEQLRMLLGQVSRELFELAHPDGLDAEDAAQALRSCAQSSLGWFPHFDRVALTLALTGALGVSATGVSDTGLSQTGMSQTGMGETGMGETGPGPAADGMSVVAHGLALIADQLRTAGLRLDPLVDSALRELRRAQTVELP